MKQFSNKLIKTFLLLCVLFGFQSYAQKKQKVDGVAAVVGDFIVLDSDVDLMYLELQSQGVDTKEITRCELIGQQLEEKLFAHQAIQDSIVVTDEEINEFMSNQMNQMVEQLGSKQKLFEYYKKKDEQDFRSSFYDMIKQNKLSSQMRRKIVEDITITPEEVRLFFKEMPKDKIPTIGTEVEIAQIMIKPEISKEDKQGVIDKLKKIRKDILDGTASFMSSAVIYSDDPGSSSNGGYYKINKKTQFVKEFKDVAFRLNEGEISEPFETEYGFHIIQVDKIIGQDIELRHILITPKPTSDAVKKASDKIDEIKRKLENGEITFEEAAKSSSDDKETKNNGGVVLNPRTQEATFELSKLDPSVFSHINDLNQGQISKVFVDQDKNGGRVFKILKVNKKIAEHQADFSQDYMKIKELALNDKQYKAVAKWLEENIEKNYVKINGEYKNCTFTNNWLKK